MHTLSIVLKNTCSTKNNKANKINYEEFSIYHSMVLAASNEQVKMKFHSVVDICQSI